MINGTDAARGEAPERTRGSSGPKMFHDLPVVSCVQRQLRQGPKSVCSGPFKVGCPEAGAGPKIEIETGSSGGAEENADIVEMEIEIAREVLFDECHANGLAAKLADIEAAASPDVGQLVAGFCYEDGGEDIVDGVANFNSKLGGKRDKVSRVVANHIHPAQ